MADGAPEHDVQGRPNAPSDFTVQMAVWGYHVWSAPTDGSLPMEKHEAVLVSEAPDLLAGKCWFDRRWTDLLSIERWHGDTQLEVPEWWALACSTDLVLAGFRGTEERTYPS